MARHCLSILVIVVGLILLWIPPKEWLDLLFSFSDNGQTNDSCVGLRLISYTSLDERIRHEDYLAYELISPAKKITHKILSIGNAVHVFTNYLVPGLVEAISYRTIWIDRNTVDALKNEVNQIVSFASGFTTQAYRLSNLSTTARFYEIDLPPVIERKKIVIQNVLGKLPDYVTYIPLDLNDEHLEEVLRSSLDFSKPSLFTMEGLSPYLKPQKLKVLLQILSKLQGSKLVFDFVLECVINKTCLHLPGAEYNVQIVEKKGETFYWGLDNSTEAITSFLNECGWKLTKWITPEQVYYSWPEDLRNKYDKPTVFYNWVEATTKL